ncbi:hypothetical protein BGX27_004897 [Mortierella sp. AM989]|nr:hypothetical protein BGX27_004897 [Mortierella sp. AM989]
MSHARSPVYEHPQPPKIINEKPHDHHAWTLKHNTQTRLYGVFLSIYAWSLWCCDHYHVDFVVSATAILTGALILWHIYPNSESKSKAESPGSGALVAQQYQEQHRQQQQRQQQQQQQQQQPRLQEQESIVESLLITEAPVISPSSIVWSSKPMASVSTASQTTLLTATVLVLAQESVQVAGSNNVGVEGSKDIELEGNGMESLSTDPSPPYYKDNNAECPKQNSSLPYHNPQKLNYHQYNNWRYMWMNIAVIGLGASGWMLCLGLWEWRSSVHTWGLISAWSESASVSLYCLLSGGVVAPYIILASAVLSRLSETLNSKADSITSEARATDCATATVPGSNVNGNDRKKALMITKLSTVIMKEGKEGTRDELKAYRSARKVRDAQYKNMELQSSTMEALLQRKANRIIKRRESFVVVRRRSFSPPSFSTIISSSLISSSIQHVKSELKIWAISLFFLAPTAVPRPRFWRSAERESGSMANSFSDRERDEYDMICRNELDQSSNAITSDKDSRTRLQNYIQKATSESWSRPSGSSLLKLARMTLDPERLGGIIQFYRQKHVTAAAKTMENLDSMHQSQDEFAFVVRSSGLPTVRVGLYGTTQKRLWTSTGSIDITSTELLEDTIEG